MDCTIPGHSVRTFCASIVSLSRIGSDLYLQFDPVDGLTLRALNDAKTAYGCIHFKPNFFERCTAPPVRKRSISSENLIFSCRVAFRALAGIVRPRKGIVSLRLFSSDSSSAALAVSFEFLLHQDRLSRVLHRIRAAEANCVSAVASTEDASELVAPPKVIVRLLEPLRRTAEAAMVIKSSSTGTVTASSFHHSDTARNSNNAILQATSASLLKTETAISCDDLEEFDFRDDRNTDHAPANVNEEVVLVFPIKETKSILQFCALDPDLRVQMYFHWGGRPLSFQARTDSYTVELVLATLSHKMLAPKTREEPHDEQS